MLSSCINWMDTQELIGMSKCEIHVCKQLEREHIQTTTRELCEISVGIDVWDQFSDAITVHAKIILTTGGILCQYG